MEILILVAIGLVAGVLSGVFGIGGGVVIVPALILFARFAPQMATGTSLAMFVLPIGLLGAAVYYRQGNVRVTAALLLALGVFCGSYFGARFAHQMSPLMLRRSFAVLLLILATRMWFAKADF
jgi:uncharacterized membrane protein YfcA